jgi:hypothetical protein
VGAGRPASSKVWWRATLISGVAYRWTVSRAIAARGPEREVSRNCEQRRVRNLLEDEDAPWTEQLGQAAHSRNGIWNKLQNETTYSGVK